jgi:hypothetical protein
LRTECQYRIYSLLRYRVYGFNPKYKKKSLSLFTVIFHRTLCVVLLCSQNLSKLFGHVVDFPALNSWRSTTRWCLKWLDVAGTSLKYFKRLEEKALEMKCKLA